jgi:hypothetical protein
VSVNFSESGPPDDGGLFFFDLANAYESSLA